MPPFAETPVPPMLTLRQIAGWSTAVANGEDQSPIRASVPALQRGLVWQPQQVEMLWDSILRGFPIGAFVVCQKVDEQERGKDDRVTHHLLDGQQRCNAITLGFKDVFENPKLASGEHSASSILWLDLNPKLDSNSTRNFLTRITTLAHPWGYRGNDDAGCISTSAIRDSLWKIGLKDLSSADYERPKPVQLWPHVAIAPIPLAWLLNIQAEDQVTFWEAVDRRLVTEASYPWTAKAREFLSDHSDEAQSQRDYIFQGIQRAAVIRIIALEAPAEILEASKQEISLGQERENISNIEHLFQRLNRQGTRLDGEELAYSMIKAYWPEIADDIDTVAEGLMPQARLVSLAVRAALVTAEQERLPRVIGVSALRKMVKADTEKRDLIHHYITKRLEAACELVGKWLRYHPEDKREGLLPVHVTSIAHGAPDLYLLLLTFAERTQSGEVTNDGWDRLLPGLVTAVHWFAKDKAKVVNRIFVACRNEISVANLREGLADAIEPEKLSPIHTPEKVQAFIRFPDKDLNKWNWWHLIEGDGSPDELAQRQAQWWDFLGFRGNRELLLYVQREFLNDRFHNYDPARRDLWEAHNRPWDFDHILAYKYFYNRRGDNTFMRVCAQLGNTIGNLRAWPFEDNRSDQYDTATQKIIDDRLLGASFVLQEELPAFSLADEVRSKEPAAREFIGSCRSRLIRIYESWYEDSHIAELLAPQDKQ